jgi:hypothetical protein
MADFHWWGTCVEQPLGFDPGTFTKAYTETLDEGVKTALESSPFAQAVFRLMAARETWGGDSSELLDDLSKLIPEKTLRSNTWPGTPAALGRAISRVRADLVRVGINIGVVKHKWGREYLIENMGKKPSLPSPPSPGLRREGFMGDDQKNQLSPSVIQPSPEPEGDGYKSLPSPYPSPLEPIQGKGNDGGDGNDGLFPKLSNGSPENLEVIDNWEGDY